MRLKICTTGKPNETKIVNAETDEELFGVSHVEVSISPFEVIAILVLNDFESDLVVDEVQVTSANTE